jgi:putative ABC transport system substrate-binding protein
MKRRDLIAGALIAVTVRRAHAQQTGKVYRIAIVDPAEPVAAMSEAGDPFYRAFFGELRRVGYIEGQNLVVERNSGGGRTEHFAELAQEVVRRDPDVILASSGRVALAFKAATATIPIVGVTADPVASGIVSNLARPGGNITGVSIDAGVEISGKRIDLLREALPGLSRVGFLASRAGWELLFSATMRDAAQRSGSVLIVSLLDAPFSERQYRDAIAAMVQQGAEAVIASDQPENFSNGRLIVELAASARLPAMYAYRELVELGGFMAYAFDLPDTARRVADEISVVLKGAKPGEIPYQQATKFERIVNLKTANALGLTIPPSLLARADEVIE